MFRVYSSKSVLMARLTSTCDVVGKKMPGLAKCINVTEYNTQNKIGCLVT